MNNNLSLNPSFINSPHISPLRAEETPLQAKTLDPNSSEVRVIQEVSKEILSNQNQETELENDDYSAQSLYSEEADSSFYDELSDDIFDSAFQEEEGWQAELADNEQRILEADSKEIVGRDQTTLSVVEEVKSKSLEEIEERPTERITTLISQLEQFPNFKNIYFENKVNSFEQILDRLKEIKEESPENTTWIQQQFKEIKEAVDKGTLLIRGNDGQFRPLTADEWKELKEKLPEIFKLYIEIHLSMPNSVKTEELPKQAGPVLKEKVQDKHVEQTVAPVKKRPLDKEEEEHKRILQNSSLIDRILKDLLASGIKRLEAKKIEEKTNEIFDDILNREIQKLEGMKREIHRLILRAAAFSTTFKERFVQGSMDGIPVVTVNDLKVNEGSVLSLGAKKIKLFQR